MASSKVTATAGMSPVISATTPTLITSSPPLPPPHETRQAG
ncbi:MAG: hypothetical protein NT106_10510 [Candidatus Sumerlaeota bacterium]|nr:hypothetical protein [Candidatus Sumerlaeota bacterium]